MALKYTKFEVNQICQWFNDGVPRKVIAKRLGRTDVGICELLRRERRKRMGIKRSRGPSYKVTICLSDNVIKAVGQKAKAAGKFKATWIRELIEREVKEPGQ